jgi:hypothetical protein
MKNPHDTIENRTHDLPACSAVPQPSALPRVRGYFFYNIQLQARPCGIFGGQSCTVAGFSPSTFVSPVIPPVLRTHLNPLVNFKEGHAFKAWESSNKVRVIYRASQQMHCSDSLLISYSCYMFRRMYVIIREPSVVCPAELH